MAATEGRQEWLTNLVSSVAAVSVLVGAVAVGPLAAVAKAKVVDNRREPVVQALVQLPDELDDWTRLVPNYDQAPGANIVITASREGSDKAVLGAAIAMEKLRFPVMMQLFPTNVVDGATWPSDFEEKGTYAVQVRVCGGGEARSAACKAPPLVGNGESIFVSGLDDVPEVAESGGMRVPATVVLSPSST
eukprot:jgi/Undpi1/12176/HiC_scaffold_5.g01852.m1